MPPKQWIPVRFGARVQLRRIMKKNEIKSDPVAEKIVQSIAYLKNNLKLFIPALIVIMVIVAVISRNLSINETNKINALKEVDEIMIELVSSGSNNSEFDIDIQNKINSLYEKYPDSESVNYLGFLALQLDSIDIQERINLIKNNISNKWFKTQAFLASGDNYSDNENYDLAKKDYKKAIEYASSNAQKGYCYYKLGNLYFETNDIAYALTQYKEADKLFSLSKKEQPLEADLQFKDWYSRNKIALYRVKNLLKK